MPLADYTAEQLNFLEERSNENSNFMFKNGMKPIATRYRRNVPIMKQCPICDTYFTTTRKRTIFCNITCHKTHFSRLSATKRKRKKRRKLTSHSC